MRRIVVTSLTKIMAGWRALAVFLMLLVGACSTPGGAPGTGRPSASIGKPYTINGVRYVPRAEPDYDRTGTASWYGRDFHNRRTASGQHYDMNAMTAAHTTLPLGTRVKVTNLANGRSVSLTINDRGPFAHGRIIDVSRRAAQDLGFIGAGTARVRVQVLAGAQPKTHIQSAQAPAQAPRQAPKQALNNPPASAYYLPVLGRAMDQGPRLSEFAWTDPNNGRTGVIVPLTEPHAASRPFCRNYRHTVGDGSKPTVYIGRACRADDGSWRIVSERKTAP